MKDNKDSYRDHFAILYRYLKLTRILKEHGESHQNFSKFMQSNHYDHYLSLDKLNLYESWFEETLQTLHNIH